VIYDHRFEAIDAGHTRLIWVVEAIGFGASILGRLFAKIYRGHLEKAIPRLIVEMENAGIRNQESGVRGQEGESARLLTPDSFSQSIIRFVISP
jgi:hypothetical protein